MTKKKTKPLDNQKRPFVFPVPEELKTSHQELVWFFQEGESACGISSNYQAFLFAMMNNVSIDSAEEQLLDCLDKHRSQDSVLRQVGKYRRISHLFTQLPPQDQHILELFFYEQQFDRSLEGHFGPGIKLIPLTKSWQKIPSQWQDLQKLQFVLIHERKLIDKIKKEVGELYFSVLTKYHQQKGDQ